MPIVAKEDAEFPIITPSTCYTVYGQYTVQCTRCSAVLLLTWCADRPPAVIRVYSTESLSPGQPPQVSPPSLAEPGLFPSPVGVGGNGGNVRNATLRHGLAPVPPRGGNKFTHLQPPTPTIERCYSASGFC